MKSGPESVVFCGPCPKNALSVIAIFTIEGFVGKGKGGIDVGWESVPATGRVSGTCDVGSASGVLRQEWTEPRLWRCAFQPARVGCVWDV